MLLNRLYYFAKPAIPWRARLALRRIRARRLRQASRDVWPIDEAAGLAPPGWPGWPDSKQFAFVLTHDVEGLKGVARIEQLMMLEQSLGFKSSFNLVPEEEYVVSDQLLSMIKESGFEVGIHGLEHDGKLYSSKASFARKAAKINSYVKRWDASGFRSPLMQHRLGWLHQLDIEYDSSTFDVDPFEPEPDGVRTIFPFWVPEPGGTGFVELPYTLAQDFSLFTVLQEKNIDIWKTKLDWIVQRGGMAMLNTHPDYMCFDGSKGARDEFPVSMYKEFLTYVRDRYDGKFWSANPREVNRFYRASVPPDNRNTRHKICMISHTHYETDRQMRCCAESLAARGDLVDVIALGSTKREPSYQLKGVNVHEIHQKNNGTSNWNRASQRFRFLCASVVRVSRSHKKLQYDLIHVHNAPDFIAAAAMCRRWAGAKFILDLRDAAPALLRNSHFTADGNYVRALGRLERVSAALSDHVIVSDRLRQGCVTRRSILHEKYSVPINRVDSMMFKGRARTKGDQTVVLLFLGSFHPHHGLDIALRALGRLKDKVPECELHIYGEGCLSESQSLVELTTALGLNARVKFGGSLLTGEIPQVMANADVGVVPKRVASFQGEPCSIEIMEFMSHGIPVVASRATVDTNSFGDEMISVFDPNDDDALAAALLSLIGDRELRDRMSSNGLAYAANSCPGSKPAEYLSLVDCLCVERFESAVVGEQTSAG